MTNQPPPPMPYGAPPQAPGPSVQARDESTAGRGPWIVVAAVLAVAALGAGTFAALSASAAREARDERDRLRDEVLDVDSSLRTAESELDDATSSLRGTRDALTQAEAATDALQVERDELQTELSEAQASVVDDANPFATQADLDGFREILAGYRETIASAATIDELTPLFVTFDSDFDRLVSLNVTADLSECKGVLANNGFATTVVIASTISNLFELDPMLVADVQAEIASSDELAETVFDQACGPVSGG